MKKSFNNICTSPRDILLDLKTYSINIELYGPGQILVEYVKAGRFSSVTKSRARFLCYSFRIKTLRIYFYFIFLVLKEADVST